MIRVILHQPTYTTHEAHDWQLNARPAPFGVTDVCARCGVIRRTFEHQGETVIRHSERGANPRHCLKWRAEEPACMTEDTQP